MPGNDSYTALLIHSDTTDGSTTFSDDGAGANCPHSIAANGNVHHETDQKKFGTTSIYFDGTGDYLSLATDANWGFGTADFTLDCWAYVAAIPSVSRFFARGNILGNNGAWSWGFGTTWGGGTKMNFAYRDSGTIRDHTSAAVTVSTATWHHFALVRDDTDLLFFLDGTLVSTVAIVGSKDILASNTDTLYVGCRAGSAEMMLGYLDELRLSLTARWTSGFTPETTFYGLYYPEIADAAALGDTLDALHLAEILTDGAGLGDELDGYYLRETIIDAVGMGAMFDPLHLVDSITDGAGLGDSLDSDIEAIVAILDGAGLGDTVDGYYLREAITDAAALSDAFDGYFLRETITDAAGLGDSADRTLEIPRTLADTAGLDDAFVCLNWSEWLRLNSGQALKRFYFTLTGDGETPAVADAVIPISSFQARLRQGEPTYLSVVIPDLDTYSAIVSARSNGQMVIEMALLLDGVEAVREEICRVTLEDINIYEGARNKSISLSGHATETYTTKITALTGASYYNLSGGLRRYRCAMDPYLKPGDTVRVNSEEFEVGYITISRSVGSETMEVVEAES